MRTKSLVLGTILVSAPLLGAIACSSDSGTNPTVGRIAMSLTADSMTVGSTVHLTGAAETSAYSPIAGQTLTWSSTNTAIATVDDTGLVTAVAPGVDTVKATDGTVSGLAVITVVAPTT